MAVVFLYLRCSHSPAKPFNEEAVTTLPGENTPTKKETPIAEQGKTPSPSRFALLHAKLPRREVIAKASEEEIHHGTPGLQEGSAVLGTVLREMTHNEKAIPDGVEFYRRCAKDEDVLTSLRAVCVKRLGEWAPRANPPIVIDFGEFDPELRELADKLP